MPPRTSISAAASTQGRRCGLLLVGHGTRDAGGVAEFLQVADQVQGQLAGIPVRPGFLELAAPGIDDGLQELVACGIDQLIVAPLLLFAAGHANVDIPAAVDAALQTQPALSRVQTSHFGLHPRILELSARKSRQAIEPLPPIPAEETLLLMVGRGSRDAGATAEMCALARLRRRDAHAARVDTAFFAMAEPKLMDSVAALATQPYRRIVVQPHLLFRGRILDRIAELVHDMNRQVSPQEWVLCEHLGAATEIVDILVEKFTQALTAQAT